MLPEQRLIDLQITLPAPPKPLGSYVEAVRTGDLLFLSGALPLQAGVPQFQGRLGDDLTVEDGRNAARLATLNALALAREHVGSLDRVSRPVRLMVWIKTTADFPNHARVADGASELLSAIYGAERSPTRMVAGAFSLPLGVSVVIDLLLALDQ